MSEEENEKIVCIRGESKKFDSREDVADIIKEIDQCDELTTLKLSGNSFGVDATKAIGESLAKKTHFCKALWSDMFVSRLKSEIPLSLIALSEGIMTAQAFLTELDLSDNAFGPTGVEPIIPLLRSPSFYSIKVLRFNNNGLGIKGGTFLSKALLECHEEAQNAGHKLALEVFVAGRNRLENDGAIALSEVFQAMRSLVHVSMPQNGINAEGICALATAFSDNPSLEVIDLNDNTFTEVGSKAMADVLPGLQNLRVINFGDCLVRSSGAMAISNAIKDGHKKLEELNLCFGELNQDAGLAVAEALANKKEIRKIDLNGNAFGEKGVELVSESLEARGHMEALGSMSDDEGSDEEEEEEEEEDGEVEKGGGDQDIKDNEEEVEERQNRPDVQDQITLAGYLDNPTGKNLSALGEDRAQLILDSLTRNSPSEEVDDVTRARDTAAMFAMVSRDYHNYMTEENEIKHHMETTIDAILQPVCRDGYSSLLINEILIQIGLLKSEDKNFVPIKDVEGPVLALKYFVKQNYFPRVCGDVLISFFTKPGSSEILSSLHGNGTVHQLLQTLHTL